MNAADAPRPALPREWIDALSLLCASMPSDERLGRVRLFLRHLRQGTLDPAGLFVLPGANASPRGVLLCEGVAGGGGLMALPAFTAAVGPADADRLVRHGRAWLESQGARLVQCLLTDSELPVAAPLLRNGFVHVTGLSYLRHDLVTLPPVAPGPPLEFACYDPQAPAGYHDTLRQTYEGTLDCPEINGVRSIDEVIEGYRSRGRFDPRRWWLARAAGQAVAVVICCEVPGNEWEVGYLGIVPQARGRGVGRAVLRFALAAARRAAAAGVTLSVDDRNLPARALYRRCGFVVLERRQVLLAFASRS